MKIYSVSKSTVSFLMFTSIVVLNVATTSIASAAIYKCTAAKSGKVYYNDKPCPVSLKEKEIRAVKDPKSVYVPEFVKKERKAKREKERLVKKEAKKVDLFGTSKYKGKETKKMHDGRIANEKKMEERQKMYDEMMDSIVEDLQRTSSIEHEMSEAELAAKIQNELDNLNLSSMNVSSAEVLARMRAHTTAKQH